MSDLPSGTVTFLFTDIEGSTPLYQKYPDAMARALTRHHALLHEAIRAQRGRVFQIIGDAFCAAFGDTARALRAALDAQRALAAEPWGETGPLHVRMGLHTGNAEAGDDDYISNLTLIRAQRIMSAAHGGQVLLSLASEELVRDQLPKGTALRDLGMQRLRGLAQPERIYQLVAPDLPADFPPLRVPELVESEDATTGLLEQLVRGRLVGRQRELEQLQQWWALAQNKNGRLVLLSGEPGVGKTRLAEQLVRHARQAGATVLRGGCYEYEAATPYLPFVEGLRQWVHAQSDATLREQLGTTASEIAKLAPEIASRLAPLEPNPALSPNEERLRLFDNVARFFQTLAAGQGLLLFLDDLHWADQGTLSLLHYLLRNLKNERLLALAAYRELELDRSHPLAAALVDWNRERLAVRLPLGRLSREDTAALLATLFGQTTISTDFTDAIFRETEGNPFFVEEVCKSLIEQGEIYRENGGWGRKEIHELAIPQSVKEAIGRRLNRLSPGSTETLHTAAALGKIFSFAELAAVVGQTEDQLLDALDEASAAQLIRPDQGEQFAFTHDKIREVLYEELNPIRRRRLHLRIGEGLEKSSVRVQDLAYHFAQGGNLRKALVYSLRAAENTERVFAYQEALSYYQQAQEAAEALNDEPQLAAIEERRGDIYRLLGDVALGVGSYERALVRTFIDERRAALKVKIGDVYIAVGDARGLPYLEQALAELNAETQPNEMALALALMGRYYHYRTEHTRSLEFLHRALELAERGGEPNTLTAVYTFLAGANQHLTRYDESDRWAQISIRMGQAKEFPIAIANGYEFMAENAFGRGYWDKTLEFAEQDYEIGKKMGANQRLAWAEFSRATGLHGKGELDAARAAGLHCLELCERIGEGRLATWVEPFLAFVESDRGDDEQAQRHAKGGLERAAVLGQLLLTCWALHGSGYAYLRRGEYERAAEDYAKCVAEWRTSENRVAPAFTSGDAAESFLNVGRLSEAMELCELLLNWAHETNAAHHTGLARRVQGQIFTAREQWDAARVAYDQAVTLLQQTGSRLELARALYRRGALHRARDETDAANADWARARELFEACGAKRELERL